MIKELSVRNFGLISLEKCSDGQFESGKDGVQAVFSTADKKVEFISFSNNTLAYVKSSTGYPAYYPLHQAKLDKPIKAVMMDLDGTSVKSEEFWIWIIEMTVASLLGKPSFQFEEADLPFVSGHSVSEHLLYCIEKYCPDKSIDLGRKLYFAHTDRELKKISEGKGRMDAFTPAPGLKEFLMELKANKIKVGLVTSGLYEKAWPEILSAFHVLNLGNPEEYYDAIITAGYPLRDGKAGTLGELSPKPHPWLYAEMAAVGLRIPFEQRSSVVGIEDSAAGVCSIRLAGFSAIGLAGGNIVSGGTLGLCDHYCATLEDVWNVLKT
jgi:beta-phosphoglucomutase-like phosphatase (HAD superfamily)